MLRTVLIAAVAASLLPLSAVAEPVWYRCIAKAASHTGRYTFRIDPTGCSVYWHEIETEMKLLACDGGIIKALKPSAISDHDIVYFDMNTGYFHDYLSGVLDKGRCTPADPPQ